MTTIAFWTRSIDAPVAEADSIVRRLAARLRALLPRRPSWQERLGCAAAPWNATGARVLAMGIGRTTWEGIRR